MNTQSLLYIFGAILVAIVFMVLRDRLHKHADVNEDQPSRQRTMLTLGIELLVICVVIGLFVRGLSTLEESAKFVAILITIVSGAFIFTSEGWIQDAFSGLGLQLSKAYQVGDLVTLVGERGRVVSIGLFRTDLETFGLDIVSVRNSQVLQNNVINHSGRPFRRVTVTVHTADYGEFGDDIDAYMETLQSIAQKAQMHICPEVADHTGLDANAYFIEFGGSSDFLNVVYFTYDQDEVYDEAVSAMHVAMARELRPRGVVLGQVNATTIDNIVEFRQVA